MVAELPPDSAAHRAQLGHSWTRDSDWLTADIRDAVLQLLVLTYNVHRGEKTQAAQPPALAPRPVHDDGDSDDDLYVLEVRAELDVTRRRIFGGS